MAAQEADIEQDGEDDEDAPAGSKHKGIGLVEPVPEQQPADRSPRDGSWSGVSVRTTGTRTKSAHRLW